MTSPFSALPARLPLGFLIWALAAALPALGSPLEIVKDGASSWSIYREEGAPRCVHKAAKEIQRVIEAATGAKLPITGAPTSPMIALGDNPAARAAGLEASALPEEAFRIATRGGDLFIVGKDTPDGQNTPNSSRGRGFSRGTYSGACGWLEEALGTRWLLPGEWGEVIPRRRDLAVAERDATQAPDFQKRWLSHINATWHDGFPETNEWMERQKLGESMSTIASHAWPVHMPEDLIRKNPAWAAVDGDKNKFCTSQPDAVKRFSESVVEWARAHPGDRYIDITPSDGGGFCKCPKCLALVEKDPYGDPSFSAVILRFYNDVARLVAAKHPDRILSGLVYYNYMYPPAAPVKMEPNLHLDWAALEYYGMGLYKPKYRDEFPRVAGGWAKLAPSFGIQSWSVWMRTESGAPYAAPLEILKLELPTLKRLGAKAAHVVGVTGWGYGGAENYLLAKLMWNASSDVDRLYAEWTDLAYGPAAPDLRAIFKMLDDGLRANKRRETVKRNYDLNMSVIQDVHLPLLPKIEEAYARALARPLDEGQKRRVEMFGESMVRLHYRLRKAGLIEDPERSVFYRSDEAYAKLPKKTLALDHADKPLWVPETPRRLVIPRLKTGEAPPAVDGDPSDAAWRSAAVAGDFRVIGGRDLAKLGTKARLLCDERALYVLFECPLKVGAKPRSEGTKRDDSRIFHGDTVEVFLCNTRDSGRFWHLALNPAGLAWDGLRNDPATHLDWTSAVAVSGSSWTAEFRLPFEALGLDGPPAGQAWRANLNRVDVGAPEMQTWNSLEEKFAEPDHFGEWKFAE
jgi:hypothetical protein